METDEKPSEPPADAPAEGSGRAPRARAHASAVSSGRARDSRPRPRAARGRRRGHVGDTTVARAVENERAGARARARNAESGGRRRGRGPDAQVSGGVCVRCGPGYVVTRRAGGSRVSASPGLREEAPGERPPRAVINTLRM